MRTHNIHVQFHDKIISLYMYFCFWSYLKNYVGTQKQVRISHGERTFGVLAIKVWLYYIV